MSDRTRFFADKNARANMEAEKRQHEAEAQKRQIAEQHEMLMRAAAVYEPAFAKLDGELRDDGLHPTITKDSKVINVIDAQTQERYAGNVFLTLTFKSGGTEYELVYLVATKPAGLGMLAWRAGAASTYFVGPQSKASPVELLRMEHVAEHHVNVAFEAMKTE